MEERGEESTEVGVASKHAAKASCCVVAEGNVVEDDREPPGSRLCVCARVFLKRLIVILHMTRNNIFFYQKLNIDCIYDVSNDHN